MVDRAFKGAGSHGLKSFTPVSSKSLVLRVTSRYPCRMATAAIMESRRDLGWGECILAQIRDASVS